MSKWLLLSAAIVAEVIGTSFLKTSNGFTRVGPSLAVVVGYAAAFYFLSLTLKVIPVGVAYAIWSGVGVVLIERIQTCRERFVLFRSKHLGYFIIVKIILHVFTILLVKQKT